MNRRTSLLMGLLIVVIVAAALIIGLRGNHSAANGCERTTKPVTHKVTIRGGKVSEDHVSGQLCDTLSITNKDAASRKIAFGLHDHHEPYDGIAERVLGKGESLTVTLNQAGSFRWHDHIHDEVQGYFTVAQ